MGEIVAVVMILVPAPDLTGPIIAERIQRLGKEQLWTLWQKRAIPKTPGTEAARELIAAGKVAVKPLARALADDPNWIIRANAAHLLPMIGDSDGLPALREAATEDEHETVRALATEALTGPLEAESLTTMIAATEDASPGVRVAAIRSLGAYFRDDHKEVTTNYQKMLAAHAISKGLDDPEGDVRYAAADEAGPAGRGNAVPALIRLLDDETRHLPWVAAQSLGQLGDRQAVVPLIGVISDSEDDYFRMYAVNSLGQIGDVRAVPALIALFEHDQHFLRRDAALAIGRIGDRRAVEPLIRLLRDESPDVVIGAVDALGELGDPSAIGPMVKLLEGGQRQDRPLQSVARSLEQLNDPRVIAPMAALLFGDEELPYGATEALARAIGAIRHPSAVRALVEGTLRTWGQRTGNASVRCEVERLTGLAAFDKASLAAWWEENEKWYRTDDD